MEKKLYMMTSIKHIILIKMKEGRYQLVIERKVYYEYDKRTFESYYISLIKTKHPIIFHFCSINDYNSKMYKPNQNIVNKKNNLGKNRFSDYFTLC